MIFYLSCTGNTRWAAQHLAEATNEKMISIPEVVNGDCTFRLHAGERIGFCLPVHGWRVQPMVRKFIEKMKLISQNQSAISHHPSPNTHYCYYLITCGDSCGEYTDQLEQLLAAKGLNVHSCCCLVMPESYVGLPFMDVDPDLREAEKKMMANGTLQKFADIVLDQRSSRMPIERGATPRLYSRVFGKFFYDHLITDKRFHVDTDECIGCGKCVKECQVGNMRMESGVESPENSNSHHPTPNTHHPVWLHNGECLTCFACYHHCPNHAISFWHFTKNKGQYYFDHNKHAKIKD